MCKKNENKQVAKIAVFITSIFVIFISVAYAFINQTLTGTKRQVITAGNLELELKEGEAITINNTLPMYDEVGMIQDSYDFTLTNKTTENTSYTLKLTDVTENVNKLDASVVKYGLEKDGAIFKDLISNLENNIIDSGTISGNQTIEYSLRLWIDESVEDETLISGKTLSYKIEVEANQHVQKNAYQGVMKARSIGEKGTPTTDGLYAYSKKIEAVTFENKINIPTTIEATNKWDISEKSDKSVMAYIEEINPNESNTKYRLHIQSDDQIIANENSSYLWWGFTNLIEMNGLEFLDTSNVTNMAYMFYNCYINNLDMSTLDMSNVTDMSHMFEGFGGSGINFSNQNNTSKLTNTSYMFKESSAYELNISALDTSHVTDMSYMFAYASISTDFHSWDTSSVVNMEGMFSNASFSNISGLDTSNVKNMSRMFADASGYVETLNTSNVENMSSMFENSGVQINISELNTSKVTDMSYMFMNAYISSPEGTIDFGTWNTSNVTSMSGMFMNASFLTDEMTGFGGCWDTSNVTDMGGMFSGTSISYLSLSGFDTTKLTYMGSMFDNCTSLSSVDISSFDIREDNYSPMFFGVPSGCSISVKNQDVRNIILNDRPDLNVM